MILAVVNTPFEAIVSAATPGLLGQITVQVYDPSDASVIVAETTAGISEPQPGTYRVELTVGQIGSFMVRWTQPDDATAEEDLVVTASPVTPTIAGAYCTRDALRAELNVNDSQLPDARADALIADACDLIDEDLGARTTDSVTGRKVVESQVEGWQWAKLARATVKLASMLYTTPDVVAGQQWKKMRGPDFELDGRIGSRFGPTIGILLNQTGLRRLTTTMSRGRERWRHGFPSNADPVYDD